MSDRIDPATQKTPWIASASAVVVIFGILILGPAQCTAVVQHEATKRVEAACAGAGATSISCALAVVDARKAGGQ